MIRDKDINFRMKDGKKQYYWTYKDPVTGKYKTLNCYDRKTLKERIVKKEAELALNISPSDCPFGDYLERWLETVRLPTCRDSTAQRYRNDLKNTLKYAIAKVPMSKLNDFKMQDFYNQLAKDKDSANAVVCVNKIIRPCIEYAAIRGDIRVNFMSIVSLPKDRAEKQHEAEIRKQKRALTTEEELLFINELSRTAGYIGHDNEVLFLTQLRMGFRIGELLALMWKDVKITEHEAFIHINKTYSRVKIKEENGFEHWENKVGLPKTTFGSRILDIPKAIIPILRRYKETQKKQLNKVDLVQTDDTLVFGTAFNGYKDAKNTNRSLDRLCKRLGIEHHSTHDLRHTFGTRCFEAGLEPKIIQTLIGDSDLSTLMNTYIHISKKIQNKRMKELDDFYDQQKMKYEKVLAIKKRDTIEEASVPNPCDNISYV